MSDGPVVLDLGAPDAGSPIDSEQLRGSAATVLEGASHFIEAHGGELAKARTWVIKQLVRPATKYEIGNGAVPSPP